MDVGIRPLDAMDTIPLELGHPDIISVECASQPPRHPRLAALSAAFSRNLRNRRFSKTENQIPELFVDTSNPLAANIEDNSPHRRPSLPRLRININSCPKSPAGPLSPAEVISPLTAGPESAKSRYFSSISSTSSFPNSPRKFSLGFNSPPSTPRSRVGSGFGRGLVGELFGFNKSKGQDSNARAGSSEQPASPSKRRVFPSREVVGPLAQSTFSFKPCSYDPVLPFSPKYEPNSPISPGSTFGSLSSTSDLVNRDRGSKHATNSIPTPRSTPSPRCGSIPVPLTDYEKSDPIAVSRLVGSFLTELVSHNDVLVKDDGPLTRFHSLSVPDISATEYLERMVVYATVPTAILLSIPWYLNHLAANYPEFVLSSYTLHRALLACVTVGAKGLSDSFWANSRYAQIGGLSTRELGVLEIDFLNRLNWKILPPAQVLDQYFSKLVQRSETTLPTIPLNTDAVVRPSILVL